MSVINYIYGPISSRRFGQSLGINPMTKKTCNYNCIYCQLGYTHLLTNRLNHFVDVEVILNELDHVLLRNISFDVITICGDGEPTLYDQLESLIDGIKKRTNKPLVMITNGANLYLENVRNALLKCDIVMPSINGYDQLSHLKINRPHKSLDFNKVRQALIDFSKIYKGQLWLEIMVMDKINVHEEAIIGYKKILKELTYHKLYLNVPVRAPSERYVELPNEHVLLHMANVLNAIPANQLANPNYMSTIKDDYEALKSILKPHPLNQFEIEAFLKNRHADVDLIFNQLSQDSTVEIMHYKNLKTYRVH